MDGSCQSTTHLWLVWALPVTALHLQLKDSAALTNVFCSLESCKKAVEPAPLNVANFSRMKKRGLPGKNTKNVPHKITNYGAKYPSAGKFPLKNLKKYKVFIKLIHRLFFPRE